MNLAFLHKSIPRPPKCRSSQLTNPHARTHTPPHTHTHTTERRAHVLSTRLMCVLSPFYALLITRLRPLGFILQQLAYEEQLFHTLLLKDCTLTSSGGEPAASRSGEVGERSSQQAPTHQLSTA